MLLLDNREVKKGWQTLKDDVCSVFQKHGANVLSAKRWDERRLAYPINQQLRGTYLLMYVDCDTQSLSAIRRDLEYSESVMRHLVLACEEMPEAAQDPEEEFDEAQVRVETTSDRRAERAAEQEQRAAARKEGGRDRRGDDRRSDDRKSDDRKADDKKVDDKKADEKKADDKKSDEASAEQPKGDESKAGESKAGESEADQAKSEENTDKPADGEARKEGDQ